MKVISIVNQKGGVAKTTSAVNLASALTKLGKKVLLIDLDPQGNATHGSGLLENDVTVGTVELFTDSNIKDCILNTNIYDLVGTTITLAKTEMDLTQEYGREFILREKLEKLEKYDYVILDCAPSLGNLTINALVASTKVLIPVEAGIYSLTGLEQLLSTIGKLERLNKDLKNIHIFLTKFDMREKLSHDVEGYLQENYPEYYKGNKIRVCAELKKAQADMKSIIDFNMEARSAIDYIELAKGVLNESNI